MPNPMLHYKYITITLVVLIVGTLLVTTFALATNYKYVNEMAQLRAQNQHSSDLVRINKFSCNTYLTSGYCHNGTMFHLNKMHRHLDTLTKAVYCDLQQYWVSAVYYFLVSY